MFFLLRCAFWLSFVAVALPMIPSHDGGPDAVARQTSALVQVAAMAVPSVAPGPACGESVEACIEDVAKIDPIAFALQGQHKTTPAKRQVASQVASVVMPRRPIKVAADPIAAELQRYAARN